MSNSDTPIYDPLTGAYSRALLADQLRAEVERVRRYGQPCSLLVFDLDHFKSVNDNYGHAAGDAAIKRCADLIRGTFRNDDFIARIGGEEFVVLLPGKNVNYAYRLAEKLRRAMETEPLIFQGQSIKLTASIGIGTSHGVVDSHTFPSLLERADICLYRAKTSGRNRIEIEDGSDALGLGSPAIHAAPNSFRASA